MRIGFITTMASAPWGGSEVLWSETAARALDAGHEVLISAYDWSISHPSLAQLIRRGARISVRKANRRVRRSVVMGRMLNPFSDLQMFRPDVVLINQGGTYDLSRGNEFIRMRRALLESERWPYVLLCHREQSPPERAGAIDCARRLFDQARIVGVLSQSLRERSEADLGIPLPHARLFQNPLNIREPCALPWPQGTSLRFASVGRIEHVKGLDLALGALSIAAWRNRDFLFDIFGEGDARLELQNRCAELKLADRVRFRGFATDIDAVWRDHHVLLLPSRAEGVPNSMLEAMLSGRPVVVSKVGGVAEWMQDGETGYLLPEAEMPALSAALELLWRDRGQLEAMGRAAYERTLARRDPDPPSTLLKWLEEMTRTSTRIDESRTR